MPPTLTAAPSPNADAGSDDWLIHHYTVDRWNLHQLAGGARQSYRTIRSRLQNLGVYEPRGATRTYPELDTPDWLIHTLVHERLSVCAAARKLGSSEKAVRTAVNRHRHALNAAGWQPYTNALAAVRVPRSNHTNRYTPSELLELLRERRTTDLDNDIHPHAAGSFHARSHAAELGWTESQTRILEQTVTDLLDSGHLTALSLRPKIVRVTDRPDEHLDNEN